MNQIEDKIKLIFLDIDGVMNHTRQVFRIGEIKKVYFEQDSMDWVSKRCIGLLNELINETDAKVVITSTWRKLYKIEELQDFFRKAGFEGEIIGTTEIFYDNESCRGDEIRDYLIRTLGNASNERSKVEYVILDDDSDMLYSQRENFVNVDYSVGLTPKIIYKAKNILNGVRYL